MSERSPLRLPTPPKHYFCRKAERPVNLTGRIDDPIWETADWTDDFVDILGDAGAKPMYRTRAKMLWTDEHFLIAAELEEPHVWATLTEHDSVIFHDNDFEVFIDPDGDCHLYAELEVNAFNTTWDLLLSKPYRTRGCAINAWEIKGLQTAVHVNGTVNDPTDTDTGWTVEIAIPWATLAELGRSDLPPAHGESMRVNFSRVQWETTVADGAYRKVPDRAEDNWVWSPQDVVDMHRPHRWGLVKFVDGPEGEAPAMASDAAALMALYDLQFAFRSANRRWAADLAELGVEDIEGLSIETTSHLLHMSLGRWHVDHDSRLWEE